jgi:hypothetical protein
MLSTLAVRSSATISILGVCLLNFRVFWREAEEGVARRLSGVLGQSRMAKSQTVGDAISPLSSFGDSRLEWTETAATGR